MNKAGMAGTRITLDALYRYNPEIIPGACTNLCPGNTVFFVPGYEGVKKPSCQAPSSKWDLPSQQYGGGWNSGAKTY